jgi:hypothetical protein
VAEKPNHITLARLHMYFTSRTIITENLTKNPTDHIEKGAKHECHNLLQRMHNLFPLELRDQVYQHIVGGRTVEVTDKDVNEWREAVDVHDFPAVSFHGPESHTLMGKDLIKHGYYLCDAREISADHGLFEFVEPWYTRSTFRFTERVHLQKFMQLDFSPAKINPLDLITWIEYSVKYTQGPRWENDVSETSNKVVKGLDALHGFKKGTTIPLEWSNDNLYHGSWSIQGAALRLVNNLKEGTSPPPQNTPQPTPQIPIGISITDSNTNTIQYSSSRKFRDTGNKPFSNLRIKVSGCIYSQLCI